MALKRTSRKEIDRIRLSGTPKERVLLFEENNWLLSNGEQGILTAEDEDKLTDLDGDAKEEFEFYSWHFGNMLKRRSIFLLYESNLSYYSALINTHLKEIDIYTYETQTFNEIILSLKEEYGDGMVSAALEGEQTLPDGAQRIVERLLSHKSLEQPLLQIVYDKDKGLFTVDAAALEDKLTEALDNFTHIMGQAKTIEKMLLDYAKAHEVEEFIPRSIKEAIKEISKEWAANKRFSTSYYKSLLKSNEIQDIINSHKMEDNGDILFLFPSYADIKIKPYDYNLFENG